MYQVIDPEGQRQPADLNTLKEWAREGRVLPDTVVLDAATWQQIRADQIPALLPFFGVNPQPTDAAKPPTHRKSYVPFLFMSVLGVCITLILWGLASAYLTGESNRVLSPPPRKTRLPIVATKDRPPMPVGVEAYLIQAYDATSQFFEALGKLRDATQELQGKSLLLLSSDFVKKVDAICDDISDAADKMEHIESVPQVCRPMDKKLFELGDVSSTMANSYRYGVDKPHSTSIESAIRRLDDIARITEDLVKEQDALSSRYSNLNTIALRSKMKRNNKP